MFEAIVANIFYGFPSRKLKIIAITGTDGKTTTTTLLYHMLKKAGLKVALVSTVAAFIGDEEIDTGFHVTTPSPFSLQKLLRLIANKHFEYVVLEVTSHGIDQNRVWGIHPTIAAITNVTHEHLDYHKNFQNYAETKAKILLRSTLSLLNQDAKESFGLLQSILEKNGIQKTTFEEKKEGLSQAYIPIGVDTLTRKLRQTTFKRFGDQEYNYQNVTIASSIAKQLSVKEKTILSALEHFPGVPGRMEEVARWRGIRVIVDFAHTPNALEQALLSVSSHPTENRRKTGSEKQRNGGRLIVVFGCAGLRDHTKRPLMGEIASRIADFVVLTAEDPRTEDVWAIIAQIKSGVKGNHGKIVTIADRYQAIEFALTHLARPGDTVIVTGKGHEKSMCFGTVEAPWSDQEAIRKITNSK